MSFFFPFRQPRGAGPLRQLKVRQLRGELCV